MSSHQFRCHQATATLIALLGLAPFWVSTSKRECSSSPFSRLSVADEFQLRSSRMSSAAIYGITSCVAQASRTFQGVECRAGVAEAVFINHGHACGADGVSPSPQFEDAGGALIAAHAPQLVASVRPQAQGIEDALLLGRRACGVRIAAVTCRQPITGPAFVRGLLLVHGRPPSSLSGLVGPMARGRPHRAAPVGGGLDANGSAPVQLHLARALALFDEFVQVGAAYVV